MLDAVLGGVWLHGASRAGEGCLHVLIPCSKKTFYTWREVGEGREVGRVRGSLLINVRFLSSDLTQPRGDSPTSDVVAKGEDAVTRPSSKHCDGCRWTERWREVWRG